MMKPLIAILLVLSVCFSSCRKDNINPNTISCLPDELSRNVIAFYPFTNGSISDYSGFERHLTNPTNALATTDREGNSNCAFEFRYINTDTSDFLTTDATAFLEGLSEFSISLWYYSTDTASMGRYQTLVGRDWDQQCPDRSGQWSAGLYDCRRAVFGAENSVWDEWLGEKDCENEVGLRLNRWFHLVATIDVSLPELTLYQNGKRQQRSVGRANCGPGTTQMVDIGSLFIGREFTGSIDDIILFNRKLSGAEAKDLYELGACCSE